jgi:hypothetical protein
MNGGLFQMPCARCAVALHAYDEDVWIVTDERRIQATIGSDSALAFAV